ncbi:MAG: class I SAM-dependent methyltransferase [Pseudonocardiaceae bacterium]
MAPSHARRLGQAAGRGQRRGPRLRSGSGGHHLARAFPACSVVGYDLYEPAVVAARGRAAQAGLSDRVRFEVRDVVKGLPERYDVVTTFDVVHDSGNPRGLLRSIHDSLEPDGRYVRVDINCSERREDNVGRLGTVMYGLSLAYCMTVSLAEGGEGLGTLGLHKAKLKELASETGFSHLRQVPIEDPFNNLYVLTPQNLVCRPVAGGEHEAGRHDPASGGVVQPPSLPGRRSLLLPGPLRRPGGDGFSQFPPLT